MFLPFEPVMATYSLFVWSTSTVKVELVDAFRDCMKREIEAETKGGAEAAEGAWAESALRAPFYAALWAVDGPTILTGPKSKNDRRIVGGPRVVC